jgi:predicted RNase H-like nuclease (RuvC/YqgF family)
MTAPDEYDHDDDDDHPSVGDGNSINDDDPEDVKARKRKERLEQNRISARESRKRKKTMIEELQRTVITLSRENKELNERNEQLRRQLMEIGTKVRVVRESKIRQKSQTMSMT